MLTPTLHQIVGWPHYIGNVTFSKKEQLALCAICLHCIEYNDVFFTAEGIANYSADSAEMLPGLMKSGWVAISAERYHLTEQFTSLVSETEALTLA